uniref:Conopressin-conophysin n=1 Tax=Conus geographus TaxID=6491 RepID=CESS_CONGE|nr:RecName: Full=Conopressin-conophysin; Contains: RecName: Full=Conopressin-G; Short=Con-G; AltName: Full=Conopressin-K; AltName: Full=Lys-conopressin-G; Contains: RecName: Full=Conophysin-G; Flags: Precursor [Conus geographus]BAO65572.1 G039_VD_Conophysin-conopressin_precursor_conopeptide [Conus geographus]
MTRSAMQMGRLTLVLCLLLLLLLTTQACFIRNCPKGGKRDVDERYLFKACMSCSFGQCVGPRICCGPRGCEMGTAEANRCIEEDEDPIPCQVVGQHCDLNNPGNIHGNCVANGICCVDDTCTIHTGCL